MNRWLYFIANAKGADQEALLSQLVDPDFEEAVNVIKGYTTEQKLRHAYDMRQNYKRLVNSYIYTGYMQGEEKGLEKGLELGERKERLKLARKLRDKGMSDEEIIQLADLALEDLAEL